jgi:hypothetical protein
VHSSGCWFIREYSLTWATLVSATSRVNTPHTPRPRVCVQHHLRGLVQVHAEELLQHIHHEIHRGVVVVEQHHLVERRRRHPGARAPRQRRARAGNRGRTHGASIHYRGCARPASARRGLDGTHAHRHNCTFFQHCFTGSS